MFHRLSQNLLAESQPLHHDQQHLRYKILIQLVRAKAVNCDSCFYFFFMQHRSATWSLWGVSELRILQCPCDTSTNQIIVHLYPRCLRQSAISSFFRGWDEERGNQRGLHRLVYVGDGDVTGRRAGRDRHVERAPKGGAVEQLVQAELPGRAGASRRALHLHAQETRISLFQPLLCMSDQGCTAALISTRRVYLYTMRRCLYEWSHPFEPEDQSRTWA